MSKKIVGKDDAGHYVYVTDAARNGHVHISGASGTGKSTLALQMVINAAIAGEQTLVINWHNTANKKLLPDNMKKTYAKYATVIDVAKEGLGMPLFSKMKTQDGSFESETSLFQRISAIFKVAADLTGPQEIMLSKAIKDIYHHKLYDKEDIKVVHDWLISQKNKVALNAAAKVGPLCEGNVIKNGNFLNDTNRIIEIDLNGLEYDFQDLFVRFIIDYLLRLAHRGYFFAHDINLFVDEAQNLSFKAGGSIYSLLNEARKLNLNLLLAYPSLASQRGMDVIMQCATAVYFKPLINDVHKVAELIDNGKDVESWTFALSRLERGEAIASGSFEVNGKIINHPLLVRTEI